MGHLVSIILTNKGAVSIMESSATTWVVLSKAQLSNVKWLAVCMSRILARSIIKGYDVAVYEPGREHKPNFVYSLNKVCF